MPSKWTEAWRLFRVKPDSGPCVLFHPYRGSKELTMGVPLVAWQGVATNPGKKGGNTFRAGWHVTLSLKDAKQYIKHFKDTSGLVICRVLVRGFRKKPRSPHPVYLAREMKVLEEDWLEAVS